MVERLMSQPILVTCSHASAKKVVLICLLSTNGIFQRVGTTSSSRRRGVGFLVKHFLWAVAAPSTVSLLEISREVV